MENTEFYFMLNKMINLNIDEVDRIPDNRTRAKSLLLKYEELYSMKDKCSADMDLKTNYLAMKKSIMEKFYKIFGVNPKIDEEHKNDPYYVPIYKCTPTMMRTRIRNKFRGKGTNYIDEEINKKYNISNPINKITILKKSEQIENVENDILHEVVPTPSNNKTNVDVENTPKDKFNIYKLIEKISTYKNKISIEKELNEILKSNDDLSNVDMLAILQLIKIINKPF